MSERPPESGCEDCEAGVPLFARACPDCGTAVSWSTTAQCVDCGAPVDPTTPGHCPACHAPVSPWDAVIARVREMPFHVDVAVSDAVPPPVSAGFDPGRGKPAGQRADYRLPLPDGTEVHVREYDDRFTVHRDRHSAEQRLRHLALDAPLETAVGATALSLLLWSTRRLPRPSRGLLDRRSPHRGPDDRSPLRRLGDQSPRGLATGLVERLPIPSLSSLPPRG
jgi:hypothetical protein